MRDAVICEPLRTPVGGFGGALRKVPAHELAATVVRSLIARTGLDPAVVDDVLLGHCYPTMEAPAIGRVVALDAGLPVTATGLQIDRRCGSGLQAVLYAALQVQSGASEVVLAGGAESMSNAPFYSTAMRWGVRGGPGVHAARRARPRPGHGGRRELPGARRDDRDRGEPAPRVRHLPHRAGRVGRAQPPTRGGGAGRGPLRRRDRARWARSSPTSTSGPTPASRCSPGCGRSWAAPTRRRRSRRATRRGRTTGPRSASSRTRSGPRSWGCGRWPGSSRGAWAGCRPRRWASAPCPPPPRPSPRPGSRWPTWTSSS